MIATGGEATLWATHVPEIGIVDPELTMRGLAIAAREQDG